MPTSDVAPSGAAPSDVAPSGVAPSGAAPGHETAPGPGAAAAASRLPPPPPRARSMWWTGRAVGLHVALVVLVPTFVALFWWQVERVRQGNTLSWAYVFEWPFFTGYAVYLWWKLVHDPVEAPPSAARTARGDTQAFGESEADADAEDDAEDEELAAYNRYLAELHTSGRRKRW